jgi:hypothetical protein
MTLAGGSFKASAPFQMINSPNDEEMTSAKARARMTLDLLWERPNSILGC